jgi:hypothetical protein
MKHTIKGWIVATVPDELDGQSRIGFRDYKPSGEYSVPIQEHLIEVDVPDSFDPRPAMVAALEEKKREVRAKFAKEVKEIDDRIASLLALECSA